MSKSLDDDSIAMALSMAERANALSVELARAKADLSAMRGQANLQELSEAQAHVEACRGKLELMAAELELFLDRLHGKQPC